MKKYSQVTSDFSVQHEGAHQKRRKECRKYVKMEEGIKQSLIRKWKIQPIGETERLLECIEYLMEVQYDLKWK